jgi:transposase
MRRGELLPSSTEVRLVCLRQVAGAVQVELRTCQPSSVYPSCGTASSRVHSRYTRKLMDLPWQGLPVSILLHTRKFFCLHERCPRKIFTEQVPGTVARYGRRSCRSSESLRWLTLALGGRAGSRLARRLGLLASRTVLLRELSRQSKSASAAPRVLGIDEWAWNLAAFKIASICCRRATRRPWRHG